MISRHTHEVGEALNNSLLIGGYSLLRIHLPQLSQTIAAGQQVCIGGDRLPVMRTNTNQQWIELLSATPQPWAVQNAALHCEVEGEPFHVSHTADVALLIAEDLGLAPITFLADTLRKERNHSLLVLLGFNGTIPFRPAPSHIMVNHIPAGVIATMPLIEEWSLPCRIAHSDEPPGCFGGTVLELAHHWLQQQHKQSLTLYISGRKEFVAAGVSLATGFGLECNSVVVGDS